MKIWVIVLIVFAIVFATKMEIDPKKATQFGENVLLKIASHYSFDNELPETFEVSNYFGDSKQQVRLIHHEIIKADTEWKDNGVGFKILDGETFDEPIHLKGQKRLDVFNDAANNKKIAITRWQPRMFESGKVTELNIKGTKVTIQGWVLSEITIMGHGYDESEHEIRATFELLK